MTGITYLQQQGAVMRLRQPQRRDEHLNLELFNTELSVSGDQAGMRSVLD